MRFIKRNRAFFFFSPQKVLQRATVDNYQNSQNKIEKKIVSKYQNIGLIYKEDVISIPLNKGEKKEYCGGLVNSDTGTLIDQAIHFDGDLSQELPGQKHVEAEIEINRLLFFGGILYDQFGHVLLDSISRLWAYSLVKELDPLVYFYVPWNTPNYLERDNYVHQIFEGFNIPHKKIIFSAKPALLKKIIIAPQKYGYGLCKAPDEHFMNFLKSFKYQNSLPSNFMKGDKIYVSRTKMKYGMGKAIGEKYFEAFLKSNGYKIFYPEDYKLNEQLTVYLEASKIVFSEGSALHACILLPNIMAEIAIIARRKDPKRTVNLITDQFVGFKKNFLWIDEVGKQYQFGLETWNAITEVNWYEVSAKLMDHKFVSSVFDDFLSLNYEEIVQKEIASHIEGIKNTPEFIRFLKANYEEYGDACHDVPKIK